jgi:Fe-S-cluster containining protein
VESETTPYACSGCGLCCKNVGAVKEALRKIESSDCKIVKAFKDFPYDVKEDGSCEKLNNEGGCEVYNDRPLCCRVEDMYKLWSDDMTKKEYYHLQAKTCNKMIREEGLPDKYLIDIKKYK